MGGGGWGVGGGGKSERQWWWGGGESERLKAKKGRAEKTREGKRWIRV